MTYQETVRVLWNRDLGFGYFHMGLEADPGYGESRPGQFVMIRLGQRQSPLLRRPFSIHRLISKNRRVTGIEILYSVVGEGTEILSKCGKEDRLDLLGPLGNGFALSSDLAGSDSSLFLAAGGIGVAPMCFLLDYLLENGIDPSRTTLFLGGKSKSDLLCTEFFSQMGITLCATTDDGSEGDRCYVTHPLEIAVTRHAPGIIFACGPMDMLQCVAGIAEHHGVPCQISIESTMACGIGVCLGCAVTRRGDEGKYLHACREGPVFPAGRILL